MKLRTSIVVSLSALALTGSLLAPAAPAGAINGCPSASGKLPIVFVHGFNEQPQTWADMSGKLSKLSGVDVTLPFDYSKNNLNRQWVTNPAIGKKLAKQVACLADKSEYPPTIISHSMGGNVVRQMFKENPSLKSKVGLVVTIGTPNTGSDVAQRLVDLARTICTTGWFAPAGIVCESGAIAAMTAFSALPALATGSQEMKVLPSWPRNVPVLAIGGNIRPTYAPPNSFVILEQWKQFSVPGFYSGTDGVVTTKSALHGVRINGLGGTFEYKCSAEAPLVLPIATKADCEHNAMLRSSTVQDRVVSELKKAIKAYTPVAPSQPSNACPSSDQIDTAVKQYLAKQGVETDRNDAGEVQCGQGWAVTSVTTKLKDGGETSGGAILQLAGTSWQVVDLGSDLSDSSACQQAPTQVRTWIGCG